MPLRSRAEPRRPWHLRRTPPPPPARPRYTAPGPGTRYSVPGPGSRSRPSPAPRPGLSGAPHGEAPPFPSFFFPPFFLFSPFLSSPLFFLWHGGGESGVAFRQGRAERSPLASARPSSSTAAQRSGESAPGRDGTAPHGITARPAPLRGSAGNAAGAALGADAEPLPRFRAV